MSTTPTREGADEGVLAAAGAESVRTTPGAGVRITPGAGAGASTGAGSAAVDAIVLFAC